MSSVMRVFNTVDKSVIISAQTGFDLTRERCRRRQFKFGAGRCSSPTCEHRNGVWLASGRLGYPGYLLRLAGTNLDGVYWDYHGQWL